MKRFFSGRRKDIMRSLQDFEYIKKTIGDSGFFDPNYYIKNNPDVAKVGYDPLDHFILHGGFEGRNPSGVFDLKKYLRRNAGARESHLNPLAYYLLFDEGNNFDYGTKVIKYKKNRKKLQKNIDIINVNFYDPTGKTLYKGGAERYVFDLAKLLIKLGHKPRIIQNATISFEKKYKDVPVIGIATGETHSNNAAMRLMSKKFNEVCRTADLVVASPIDLACEIKDTPVIGINHGIHWDSIRKSLQNNRASEYTEIFDALENVAIGVCVDTNFINWTRTYDYALGEKLRYIPNYYDNNIFKYMKKDFQKELNVVYPRRLYDARGIYITLKAFDGILNRHSNVHLRLVGQTDDSKVSQHVSKMIKKFPNQVTLTEYSMDDMHKAYKDSHIALIPTRYSEGTSLSCIEAMATNNAVVATNVGGLPNLVIDSYNGLLIDPSTKALEDSMELLISDRNLMEQLANKACSVAAAFDKEKWNRRWEQLIKEIL